MRKSKYRHFYHIFVSLGNAPGAITLSVAWMEREFDAYKLSCSMYPSNYNRFLDRARYLWKKKRFFIPLLYLAPPLRVTSVRILKLSFSWWNRNKGAIRWWKNLEDVTVTRCDDHNHGPDNVAVTSTTINQIMLLCVEDYFWERCMRLLGTMLVCQFVGCTSVLAQYPALLRCPSPASFSLPSPPPPCPLPLYAVGPWEWQTLGMADPGNGEPVLCCCNSARILSLLTLVL